MTTIFIRYSVSYSNVYLYYHLILHNLFKDPWNNPHCYLCFKTSSYDTNNTSSAMANQA